MDYGGGTDPGGREKYPRSGHPCSWNSNGNADHSMLGLLMESNSTDLNQHDATQGPWINPVYNANLQEELNEPGPFSKDDHQIPKGPPNTIEINPPGIPPYAIPSSNSTFEIVQLKEGHGLIQVSRNSEDSAEQIAIPSCSNGVQGMLNLQNRCKKRCEERETPCKPQTLQKTLIGCSLCGSKIINFLRHLREFHKISHRVANRIQHRFKVTGSAINKLCESKVKKYVCAIKDCKSIVYNLHRHLVGTHNLKKTDPIYKLCTKSARILHVPLKGERDGDGDDDDDDDILDAVTDNEPETSLESDEDNDSMLDNSLDNSEVPKEVFNEINPDILQNLDQFCQSLNVFTHNSENNIRQTRHQIMTILKYLGNEFLNEETLSGTLKRLETDFVIAKLEILQASTIKNYLLAFKHFITYAKIWKLKWISFESCDRIEKLITFWNKKLKVLILKRACEKKLIDKRCSLTEEDFVAYFNSQEIKNVHIFFNEIVDEKMRGQVQNISENQITASRNFLLMLLAISNGSRPSPIINMSITDIQNAIFDKSTGRYVIDVLKHKTLISHGWCQLSLCADGYGYLITYVYKLRPLIKGSDQIDQVFITKNAKSISQSELTTILTAEVQKALVQKGRRITCSLIRKSIVSIMLNSDIGTKDEKDLASLMSHSVWIQQNIYNFEKNSHSKMARMGDLVFKLCTKNKVSLKDLSKSDKLLDTNDSEIVPDEAIDNVSSSSRTVQGQKGVKRCTVLLDRTLCKKPAKNSQPIENPNAKIKPWPAQIRLEVSNLFEKYIKKEFIRSADVQCVLEKQRQLLRKIQRHTGQMSMKVNCTKISDLVRTIIKKNKKKSG